MNLPDRRLLLSMTFGAISAAALTIFGPGMVAQVFGDEMTIHGIDPASLVRFENRDYIVDYENWVATDPLSTRRVKKVEAGRVSYVTITTTATGTYSTDAMFSDHVQYPGVSVALAEPEWNAFRYWTNGRWSSFSTGNAGSFRYYQTTRN